MKQLIKRILKKSKWLYHLYYFFGSFLLSILKILMKPNDRLILFVSFGGKRFDDSPKAIYEYLKSHREFSDYQLVWAFDHPDLYTDIGCQTVKIDTYQYFKIALQARYWITNSAIERGLKFKGRKTYYLNTWHGTPIKKMGIDIENKQSFKSNGAMTAVDMMLAQSCFEADIFSRVFSVPKDHFLICGLPRNDALASPKLGVQEELRKKLKIQPDKKVILYAPTFREYEKDISLNCVMVPPIDFAKWQEQLGDNYLVLFRAHYEVSKIMQLTDYSDFVIDVSNYSSLNELMLVSDMLISDYSSIIFDYAITGKPILCFGYDINKYQALRGMYLDLNEWVYGGVIENEDQLIGVLQTIDETSARKQTEIIRQKFVEQFGTATQTVVETLFSSNPVMVVKE